MTAAEWAILVPAIASLAGAVAAWLKAKTAQDIVLHHMKSHAQSEAPK